MRLRGLVRYAAGIVIVFAFAGAPARAPARLASHASNSATVSSRVMYRAPHTRAKV